MQELARIEVSVVCRFTRRPEVFYPSTWYGRLVRIARSGLLDWKKQVLLLTSASLTRSPAGPERGCRLR